MNKRNDLLDRLRDYYLNTRSAECKLFLNDLYRYYKQTDIETGRNHGEIFKSLYLSETPSSYDELSAKFYIDLYTLDRYRQRYNKLAELLAPPALLEQVNPANTVG